MALAVALLVALALRMSALFDASLDVPEIRLFPRAAIASTEASATDLPGSSGYGRLLHPLWERTLSEGWVRAPGLGAGIFTLIVVFLLVRMEIGPAAAAAAVWVLALLPPALRSSMRVDPAAWAGLGTVAALWLGLRAARVQRMGRQTAGLLGAAALLAAVLTVSPAGWWAWAALSWTLWSRVRLTRARTVLGLVWAATTVALLAWQTRVGLPRPSVFFFPLDRNALLTWWGLGSPTVGVLTWAAVLAGFAHAARKNDLGWLVVASLGALALAVTANWQRWLLDSGGALLLAFPPALLGAAAVQALASRATRTAQGSRGWLFGVALLAVIAVLGPTAWKEARTPTPNWRLVAETLRSLRGPGDILVPVACRDALIFYEPELAFWAKPDTTPAAAVSYFPSARAGWLIAPSYARLFPGWEKVTEWARSFRPVDASPDPGVVLLRYDRSGPDAALRTLAYQSVPAPSLWRGRVLLEMIRSAGPVPPVLWKVDQLVFDRGQPTERNGALLEVVSELVQQKQFDRAASLALRLARQFPDWEEARATAAAFQRKAAATPAQANVDRERS